MIETAGHAHANYWCEASAALASRIHVRYAAKWAAAFGKRQATGTSRILASTLQKKTAAMGCTHWTIGTVANPGNRLSSISTTKASRSPAWPTTLPTLCADYAAT